MPLALVLPTIPGTLLSTFFVLIFFRLHVCLFLSLPITPPTSVLGDYAVHIVNR